MELSLEETKILLAALDLLQLYGNDYAVSLNQNGYTVGAKTLAHQVDAAPTLAERLKDHQLTLALFGNTMDAALSR